MPYIKQQDRAQWDSLIESTTKKLIETDSGPGDLNYVISSIVWKLFKDIPNYANANELMGVLECVKQEFYRRQVAEYENKKIVENGDL